MSPVGEWFLKFFTYSRYVAELLIMALLFCRYYEKREGFWKKFSLLVSITLVVVIGLTFLARAWVTMGENYYRYGTFTMYFINTLPSLFLIAFFYNTSKSNRFFMLVSLIVVRSIATEVFNIFLFSLGTAINDRSIYLMGSNKEIFLLVYYPLWALVVVGYMRLIKIVISAHGFVSFNSKLTAISALAIPMQFLSSFILNRLQDGFPLEYIICLIFSLLSTLTLISVQFLIIFIANKALEQQLMEQQHQNSIHEFELLQDNMDLINQKVHDFRHQLRQASLGEKIDPNFLEEFRHSLTIYDNSVATGNKELDLILVDTKFRCSHYDVKFNVIADGKCISFMEKQDIVSLFSNILENALNYEKKLVDKNKRVISLNVATKNGFIHIEEENQLGEIVEEKTNESSIYHGYGIPSIKRVAKKYDGFASFFQNESIYRVSITIPLPIN
ncbi:MAG: GHKL domain-containing protein [Bacilli bacterium]|nr:GHKL domain-containing protein [Bacilli bacterium]